MKNLIHQILHALCLFCKKAYRITKPGESFGWRYTAYLLQKIKKKTDSQSHWWRVKFPETVSGPVEKSRSIEILHLHPNFLILILGLLIEQWCVRLFIYTVYAYIAKVYCCIWVKYLQLITITQWKEWYRNNVTWDDQLWLCWKEFIY